MINRINKCGILVVFLILTVLVFTSCPEPLEKPMLDVARDELPPEIQISSPLNDAFYRSLIIVQGKVSDHIYNEGDGLGTLSSENCTWSVLNHTGFNGQLELDEQGMFSFSIDSSTFSGTIVIELSAVDAKGNSVKEQLSLVQYSSAPEITILTPLDNSVYGIQEIVTGVIRNNPGATLTNEVDFDSLKIEVGSIISSTEAAEEDLSINPSTGEFSFSFDTHTLSRPETITVSVSDKNGNLASVRVRILNSGAGPVINIESPSNYSTYTDLVTVHGTIVNPDESGTDLVNPETVGWSIMDNRGHFYRSDQTDRPEGFNFEYDPDKSGDGDFSLTYQTAGMGGRHTIVIQAETHHQQASSTVLYLENEPDGPYLEILSPQYGSEYRSSVTIVGKIQNAFDDLDLNLVDHLSWKIPSIPSLFGEDVPFKNHPGEGEAGYDPLVTEDGVFSFTIDFPIETKDRQSVQITAEDIHGDTETVLWVLNDDRMGPAVTVYRDSAYTQAFGSDPSDELFGSGNNMKTVYLKILNSEDAENTGSEIIRAEWEVVNHSLDGLSDTFLAAGETAPQNGLYSLTFSTEVLTESSVVLRITAEHEDSHVTVHEIVLENDRIPPIINVTSPVHGDFYYDSVTLQGSVLNGSGSGTDDILSVSWYIPGSIESIPQDIANFSAFTEVIETASMNGVKNIIVQATDHNGNTSSQSISVFDDTSSPEVIILSHVNYQEYGWTETVTGTVFPVTGNLGNVDQDSIRYSLNGGITWEIPTITNHLSEPGYDFEFPIDTSEETDNIIFTVAAADVNGDETLVSVTLVNDGTGPELNITSPVYGQDIVAMVGLDIECPLGDIELKTLEYAINGVIYPVKTEIDPGQTAYHQVLDLSGFSSDISVLVTAVDKQDNETVENILLNWTGNGLPSFAVDSVYAGQVNLKWDLMAGSDQFCIYYTDDGSFPSGSGGIPTSGTSSKVITPVTAESYGGRDYTLEVVTGLNNGNSFSFLLEHLDTGVQSGIVSGVPLSAFSLIPQVTSKSKSIEVEWLEFPSIGQYTVQRSVNGSKFFDYRTMSETSLLDFDVESGFDYAYRIQPSDRPNLETRVVEGNLSKLENQELQRTGYFLEGKEIKSFGFNSDQSRMYVVGSYEQPQQLASYQMDSLTLGNTRLDFGDFKTGTDLAVLEPFGTGDVYIASSCSSDEPSPSMPVFNYTDPALPVQVKDGKLTEFLHTIKWPGAVKTGSGSIHTKAGPTVDMNCFFIADKIPLSESGTGISMVGIDSGVWDFNTNLSPHNAGTETWIQDIAFITFESKRFLAVLSAEGSYSGYASYFSIYDLELETWVENSLLKLEVQAESLVPLTNGMFGIIGHGAMFTYYLTGDAGKEAIGVGEVIKEQFSGLTITGTYAEESSDIVYILGDQILLAFQVPKDPKLPLIRLERMTITNSGNFQYINRYGNRLLIAGYEGFDEYTGLGLPGAAWRSFAMSDVFPDRTHIAELDSYNNTLYAVTYIDQDSNFSDFYFQTRTLTEAGWSDHRFSMLWDKQELPDQVRLCSAAELVFVSYQNHLQAFDVSSKTIEYFTHDFVNRSIVDMTVSSHFLSILFDTNEIEIFDISTNTGILDSVYQTKWDEDIGVSLASRGSDLYVGTKSGVARFDLNNIQMGGTASYFCGIKIDNLAVDADFVIASGSEVNGQSNNGVFVLDRQSLEPLSKFQTYFEPGHPGNVATGMVELNGHFIMTGNRNSELSIIDYSNPKNLILMGSEPIQIQELESTSNYLFYISKDSVTKFNPSIINVWEF